MRRVLLATQAFLIVACSDPDETGITCGPGTHAEGQICVPGDNGPDAGTSADAAALPPGAKRVFVTRTTYKGNLGGLAGADALCQNAATAASLGGTWKAWLSDFDFDAIDRITGDGPWYNVAGTMVFANHAALSTAPAVGVEVQENGESLIIGARVWTGTAAGGSHNGRGSSDYCYEWTSETGTSTVGNTLATDGAWTDSETVTCVHNARLYCFEL